MALLENLRDLAQWGIVRRRVLTLAGNQVNLAVALAAVNKAVVFTHTETDASYGVVVSPNWLTTYSVTAKTTTGCTVNFGTAAPANAAIDIFTFRAET